MASSDSLKGALMSELSHVVDGLVTMTEPQLLAAFVACGAYALAQSALLDIRSRKLGWLVAAGAALTFVLQSSEWPQATMLCAFAVAGLGVFAALAWLISRWTGVAQLPVESAGAMSQAHAAAPGPTAIAVAPTPLPAAAAALSSPRIRVRRKAYPG
jgi:hypothetical protein